MAKLLLVAPTCNGEDVGEASIAYQWAQRLGERHEVTLLTYHKIGARPASQQLRNVNVIEWREPPLFGRAERLNSIVKPGYIPFYFRARRWIRKALSEGKHFDLAHQPVPVAMRYPSPAANLGLPLVIGPVGGGLSSPPGFEADERSAPWFMSLRRLDTYRQKFDPILRGSFQSADCVLGIADYVRDQLSNIPLKRFEVMGDNALDAIPALIRRQPRSGSVKLLYVGRLVRTKGARDLIRAMTSLLDLPVELDIVGDGPDRTECERLIAEFGLEHRVHLYGWVAKETVSKFYRQADVFVFPSYREPGGRVVLEAMAYSLPLIIVDRGGPASATTENCAIKLAVSTPDMLANDISVAARRLVTSPELRGQMGAAAHAHAMETALWSAKLERMNEIFAELINRDRKFR